LRRKAPILSEIVLSGNPSDFKKEGLSEIHTNKGAVEIQIEPLENSHPNRSAELAACP